MEIVSLALWLAILLFIGFLFCIAGVYLLEHIPGPGVRPGTVLAFLIGGILSSIAGLFAYILAQEFVFHLTPTSALDILVNFLFLIAVTIGAGLFGGWHAACFVGRRLDSRITR